MQYSKFMANLYRYEENSQKEISGVARYENIGKSVKIGIKLCFPKRESGIVKTYLILGCGKKHSLKLLLRGKMYQRVFSIQKVISEDEIDKMQINVNEIKGVYIIFDDNKFFAALWENDKVDFSTLKLLEDNQYIENNENSKEEVSEIEKQEDEGIEEILEVENILESDKEIEGTDEVKEMSEESQNYLKEETTVEEAEIKISEVKCEEPVEKTSLMALRQLPKKYWNLGNNNFLLHGYYNYHHIYLKNCGERWIVGVPGAFYPEEHKVAKIFGFDGFLAKDELVNLDGCFSDKDDYSKNVSEYENGTFGYWCVSVDIIE